MKLKIIAALLLGTALWGCQKEDRKDVEDTGKTAVLVQSAWKFESAGLDLDKNGTIETPLPASILQPCLTDNTITFSTNGAGVVDEGATKCDAAAPPITPFTWSFASNETVLNVNGSIIAGTSGGQFKINELSSTRLSLSKDTTLPIIGSVALVANLKH